MELTEEQIKFLDEVCMGSWSLNENGEVDVEGRVWMRGFNLTKIPVKFGRVSREFGCSDNNLTSLENCPTYVGLAFYCSSNKLTDYFKNIKEEDFPHWSVVNWLYILEEYPFLINIGKKYFNGEYLKYYLDTFPQTKLYYRD
jgi:hypothetical protein